MKRCAFCLASGANISCCDKICRKAFHLPCASKQNCRFEFCGAFESFCDRHHNIEQPKNCHEPNDMCLICHQPMGEYNPIQSMPITCCNTGSWLHKYCLQKYAQTSGYFVKCPLCNDVETFRKNIRRNGVFVPDRYLINYIWWIRLCLPFTDTNCIYFIAQGCCLGRKLILRIRRGEE